MTPTQVQDVLNDIARLFPKSRISPPEMDNWADALLGINIDREQAEAVVAQHRREHDYSSPKLSVLLAKMTAAQQVKRIQNAARSTGNRLVDRYRRHFGDEGMDDTSVALRVAMLMANGTIKIRSHDGSRDSIYSTDQVRGHLIDVLVEFMDKRRAEDIAYREYPHAQVYSRIIERRNRVDAAIMKHEASGGKIKLSDMLLNFTSRVGNTRNERKASQ